MFHVKQAARPQAFVSDPQARRVLGDGGTLCHAELHPYRQFDGTEANLEDEGTDETARIDAITHPVSEFVMGLDTGFAVREMGSGERTAMNGRGCW